MMNELESLFYNWTGRRKGIPKGVDETHHTYSHTIEHNVIGI